MLEFRNTTPCRRSPVDALSVTSSEIAVFRATSEFHFELQRSESSDTRSRGVKLPSKFLVKSSVLNFCITAIRFLSLQCRLPGHWVSRSAAHSSTPIHDADAPNGSESPRRTYQLQPQTAQLALSHHIPCSQPRCYCDPCWSRRSLLIDGY